MHELSGGHGDQRCERVDNPRLKSKSKYLVAARHLERTPSLHVVFKYDNSISISLYHFNFVNNGKLSDWYQQTSDGKTQFLSRRRGKLFY